MPDTDIQDLEVENIGVGVRSVLNLFCFDPIENIGVDIITALKVTHDNADKENNDKNISNVEEEKCEKDIVKYDILDFETENYYKIGLLSLQNLCNFGKVFPSICELLEECNLIDAISFLRSRLIESRLRSVEVGIIGKIISTITEERKVEVVLSLPRVCATFPFDKFLFFSIFYFSSYFFLL